MSGINEEEAVFQVWAPDPGANVTTDGMTFAGRTYGSAFTLGAAFDSLYVGAGIRTYGHVFINAMGRPDDPGSTGAATPINWYSRITLQSTGQGVFQTLYQPLYLLSGDTAVLAANGDAFVTSANSVNVGAGWGGTTADSTRAGEMSVDPGPRNGTDSTDAPKSPLLPSYVNGLKTAAEWANLASTLNTTLDSLQTTIGATADLGDDEAQSPSAGAAFLRAVFPTTLASVAGVIGGVSPLLSALKPFPLHPSGADNARSAAPTLPPAGSFDLLAALSNKLNLSAYGGIQGVTPGAVSFLAALTASITGGATASLSALGMASLVGGVSAKVSSLASTAIASFRKVRITAGHEVQVQARTGDVGIRGKRVQIGYARNTNESQRGPTGVSDTGQIAQFAMQTGATVADCVGSVAALGSSDPLIAATAALFIAGATAATAEAGIGQSNRDAARTAAAHSDTSDEMSILDGFMPDKSAPDANEKHVLPATDESIYQQETDDLFLKAKKTIRAKSNDEIQVGAAKKVAIRVGNMHVRIDYSTSDGDSVVIGAVSPSDPNTIQAPFIELKHPTSADDTAVTVCVAGTHDSPTRMIKMTGGTGGKIRMQSGDDHWMELKDDGVHVSANDWTVAVGGDIALRVSR